MPLNLDSCIAGVFTPGNIGASSGQTPVQPSVPSFEVGNYGVGLASGVGSAVGETANRTIGSAAGTGTATAVGSTGAVATSYANAGGTGDRTASIAVSTTNTTGGSTVNQLVDGTTNNEYWWTGGETTRVIVFDFGVGASKVIDEFKWDQDVGIHNGTWCFEGSNDGSSYTTFPESFLLGTANGPQTVPITNSTGYRYYRLRQTAGTTTSTAYKREIEFKIA